MRVAVESDDCALCCARQGGQLPEDLKVTTMNPVKLADGHRPSASIPGQRIKPVVHDNGTHDATGAFRSHHKPRIGNTRGMNK